MTKSEHVADALCLRCSGHHGMCSRPGGGRHATASGQIAKDAARYPRKLCQAILRGTAKQLRADSLVKDGCFGIQVPDDDAAVEAEMRGVQQGFSGAYKDDLTGQVLEDSLVREAWVKELTFFRSKGVWLKRPRGEARRKTGRPPISARWVDVNKGDDLNPNYRSRLVAP